VLVEMRIPRPVHWFPKGGTWYKFILRSGMASKNTDDRDGIVGDALVGIGESPFGDEEHPGIATPGPIR